MLNLGQLTNKAPLTCTFFKKRFNCNLHALSGYKYLIEKKNIAQKRILIIEHLIYLLCLKSEMNIIEHSCMNT